MLHELAFVFIQSFYSDLRSYVDTENKAANARFVAGFLFIMIFLLRKMPDIRKVVNG